jgi:hypothetical protein
MIAALIFGISFLTLMQFFVSYSRALIAESQTRELSEQTREICGITGRMPAGNQFRRLLQLIALCPETRGEGSKVIAVSVYFRLLDFVRALSAWVIPSAQGWVESERSGCAYVAAVVLDGRIAHNRRMMAQQASH